MSQFRFTQQISISISILIPFSVSILILKPITISGVVIGMIPCIMAILMLTTTRETARFYLLRNKYLSALQELSWMRNRQGIDQDIIQEVQALEKSVTMESKGEDIELKTMVRDKSFLRPLSNCVALFFFQQLVGINAVNFYTEPIFKISGYQGNPGYPPVAMMAAQLISVIISTPLFVEKYGRRKMLLGSGAALVLSNILLGTYFLLAQSQNEAGFQNEALSDNTRSGQDDSSYISWMAVFSLILYKVAYVPGWGAIPWLLLAELPPPKARGLVASLATIVHWIMAFAVTLSFFPAQEVLGAAGVFYFFSVMCFCGIIVVYLLLPETKGKSLEEIQQKFA